MSLVQKITEGFTSVANSIKEVNSALSNKVDKGESVDTATNLTLMDPDPTEYFNSVYSDAQTATASLDDELGLPSVGI